MIANFHNILIGNVKKLLPNFLDKEKYVIHYELIYSTLLETRIELKNRVLEFNQSQWLKQRRKNIL